MALGTESSAMNILKHFIKDESGHLVADIGKAAAAIAFLSVIAANFVSTQIAAYDKDRLTEVASVASRGKLVDPITTGSLRNAAQTTRFDPCTAKN
jgi:hypothetical protein